MGGRPLLALNLCCFPEGEIENADLNRILRGGMDAAAEAGCLIVGGHTVRDPEIKFGYAVTGLVDPRRILTNAGGRPGDVLVLTKPIGTGVIGGTLSATLILGGWSCPTTGQTASTPCGGISRTRLSHKVAPVQGAIGETDVTPHRCQSHVIYRTTRAVARKGKPRGEILR